MSRVENDLASEIRLKASELGVTLWRNNSGVATNRDGRPVRFGLGNDSAQLNAAMKTSDLIGITSRGLFVAFELKKPGWRYTASDREEAQWNFINYVQRNGGIAGFVDCWADAEQLFEGRL